MGEVYKARDTRLKRDVAIKVLADISAHDPARVARFQREAQLLAALNHPHIAAMYDIGHHEGIDFLVMQYLEGETLAGRLVRGPVPIADVLSYAADIADALDAAHQRMIVHRDLKPANIMLTRAGAVLLDFGLGSISEAASQPLTSSAPTRLTIEGTLLGTVGYMAPEQVEGREADTRSDLFAFGAILYEMIEGRRAFDGASAAIILGAIVRDDPPPLSPRAATPPTSLDALDRVVRRCLAKAPVDRWQSAGDLRAVLRWISDGRRTGFGEPPPSNTNRRAGIMVPVLTAMAAALATGVVMWRADKSLTPSLPSQVTSRFAVPLAPDSGLSNLDTPAIAIAPDARRIVYVGGTPARLYVRNTNDLTAKPVAGTEGASSPFFSPDGNWRSSPTAASTRCRLTVAIRSLSAAIAPPIPAAARGATLEQSRSRRFQGQG